MDLLFGGKTSVAALLTNTKGKLYHTVLNTETAGGDFPQDQSSHPNKHHMEETMLPVCSYLNKEKPAKSTGSAGSGSHFCVLQGRTRKALSHHPRNIATAQTHRSAASEACILKTIEESGHKSQTQKQQSKGSNDNKEEICRSSTFNLKKKPK